MKQERLNSIINAFTGKKVAVIGDLMIDVYLWGKATRISQEAPVPVVNVQKKTHCLGGASNVMRNAATLGASVMAFGVVGDDENGRIIRSMLDDYSIDAANVLCDSTRRTTEKQRLIAGTQQLVRIDYEETEAVSSGMRDRIVGNLLELIEKREIDAIIFEDYAKGMLDSEILNQISAAARKANIVVALDPHPNHPIKVSNLTLMTPNRMEAFGLAGIYFREEDSSVKNDVKLQEVALKIKEIWGPEYLLITLGAQGMALFQKDGGFHSIPTRAREVFDVSGAGDTVISTFTLSLLGGAGPREAAEIANHAAGVVVGKVGTVTVTIDELFESFGIA
ncbi:MAG: hypothetical protein A2017_04495 [Lentisphaerae bacterium GWF2_44_16]|nr:MAG: hypothetical protein A2017_04495 [Lentisphaerae bacterium GWF2_44_16]